MNEAGAAVRQATIFDLDLLVARRGEFVSMPPLWRGPVACRVESSRRLSEE